MFYLISPKKTLRLELLVCGLHGSSPHNFSRKGGGGPKRFQTKIIEGDLSKKLNLGGPKILGGGAYEHNW